MILQGVSAETLARLMALARHGEDYSGLLWGPVFEPAAEPADAKTDEPERPTFRLAAE